jgi:hypothetical protein
MRRKITGCEGGEEEEEEDGLIRRIRRKITTG